MKIMKDNKKYSYPEAEKRARIKWWNKHRKLGRERILRNYQKNKEFYSAKQYFYNILKIKYKEIPRELVLIRIIYLRAKEEMNEYFNYNKRNKK